MTLLVFGLFLTGLFGLATMLDRMDRESVAARVRHARHTDTVDRPHATHVMR